MELDNHLKNLLRELGHALNDAVSESGRVMDAIAGVKAQGYDLVLKLDATIGLARRDPEKAQATVASDRRFLESLRIQADADQLPVREEKQAEAKLNLTPQDAIFLKSLRITRDDETPPASK